MSFIPVSKVLPVHHVNPPSDSPYKQAFQTTPRPVSEAVHSKDDFAALWERFVFKKGGLLCGDQK